MKSAALWREFMSAMPPRWFGPETHHLLEMLCRHIVAQEKIATKVDQLVADMAPSAMESEDLKEMRVLSTLLERQTGIVANLSCHLRLTPKSRGEYRKKDVSSAPSTNSQRRPWDKDWNEP